MTEITIADVTAYIGRNIACVLCQGCGKVMLTSDAGEELWKHARPCPICRGAGQIHVNRLPTQEQISEAMSNYKF